MLFQDPVTNFPPEYVSCIGREISWSHDNKILRPFANFMINRAQFKFKNH